MHFHRGDAGGASGTLDYSDAAPLVLAIHRSKSCPISPPNKARRRRSTRQRKRSRSSSRKSTPATPRPSSSTEDRVWFQHRAVHKGIAGMITVFGVGRGFRVVWLLEEMGLGTLRALADAKATSGPWKHVVPRGHGPPRRPGDDRRPPGSRHPMFARNVLGSEPCLRSPIGHVCGALRPGASGRRIFTSSGIPDAGDGVPLALVSRLRLPRSSARTCAIRESGSDCRDSVSACLWW